MLASLSSGVLLRGQSGHDSVTGGDDVHAVAEAAPGAPQTAVCSVTWQSHRGGVLGGPELESGFVEDDTRIQNAGWIERALDPQVQLVGIVSDLTPEPFPLESADPVLARDRAVQRYGQIHDLAVRLTGRG